MKKLLKPIHPGEILQEEFLKPLGLSQNKVAIAIGVPPRRINEIVLGKRGISADTALRLGAFFRMDAEFWLNLQKSYELKTARLAEEEELKAIKPFVPSEAVSFA
jgi:addiction module HigA family antidote